MSKINLDELRDKAYKTACEHGFHDQELSNDHFFCLAIPELMKAMEAGRKGRHANVDWHNEKIVNSRICQGLDSGIPKECGYEVTYNETIEGSIEGELADAVIRSFDLAGLRGVNLEPANGDIDNCIENMAEACKDEIFTESIYSISTLPVKYDGIFDLPITVNGIMLLIFGLARHLDIDLLWRIEQRMKYNESRGKMHKKKY